MLSYFFCHAEICGHVWSISILSEGICISRLEDKARKGRICSFSICKRMNLSVESHISHRTDRRIRVTFPDHATSRNIISLADSVRIILALKSRYIPAEPQKRHFQTAGDDKTNLWYMGNRREVGIQVMCQFSVDYSIGAATVRIYSDILI